MERGAARLCRGLPLSGAGRLESAREKTERGWTLCARGRMRGEGSQSLWSHRSPVCKEWCVCVCECARVRACVAVGGGVPGVLQHQTEPRAGALGERARPTAPSPVPHLTPRPPSCRRAASLSPPPAGPALPSSAGAQPLLPAAVGSGTSVGPRWSRLRWRGQSLRPTDRKALVLPASEKHLS